MINLRYHIVSLTAVFLALAIGVTMGTTFLNKQAVEQLNRQVKRAESGIQKTRDDNAALRRELDQYKASDVALNGQTDRLFANELTNVPILVIAPQDIDGPSLNRVRDAVVAAGADLRGTLRITDRARADAGDEANLAKILGVPAASRAVLQGQLTDRVGTALLDAAKRSKSSNAGAPKLVQDLLAAKYLSFEAPSDTVGATTVLANGGYRYLFVTGAEPNTPDADFLLPVLRAMTVDGPAPVVVTSAATGAEPETSRVTAVGPIRTDPSLRAKVSTVDDLELFVGLTATVYAVADLDQGLHGHYGFGAGADSVLPEGS